MRFNKGSTYPVGECGMFSASIDDATGDGGKPWGSRIECYGKTAEEAETLRDLLLAAITEAAEHEKCNALDGTIDTTVAKVFELGQRYQRAADIPDHVACQAVEAELTCLQLKQTRDVLMAYGEAVRDTVYEAIRDGGLYSPASDLPGIDLDAIADHYASKVQPEPVNQQLLAALKDLAIDMKIAQGNMRIAAIRDPKWEGCAEAIQPRVDAAEAAIAAAEAAQQVGEAVAWVSPECLEWLKDRAKHLDCPIQFHGRTLPLGNYSIALYAQQPASAQPVAVPDGARKVFICDVCEGVYADEPVTNCDCTVSEKTTFSEGYIVMLPAAQKTEGV